MQSDSSLVSRIVVSPNHGERHNGVRPHMLILHYTGMADDEAALARLADRQSDVSCHYFIHRSGEIIQMVPESRRAWHAGQSSWEDITDINSHSIGVEIANPGHDWGYSDFPDIQMQAVMLLCADIADRHAILPPYILGHSDIAPLRKADPGEKFDWQRLADAGIGLFVPPEPLSDGPVLSPGDGGAAVEALQAMLAVAGYGISVSGVYDQVTTATVRAFQRHFRPACVDGVCDASTLRTLRRLMVARARFISPRRLQTC